MTSRPPGCNHPCYEERVSRGASLLAFVLIGLAACNADGPIQGEPYLPKGDIPIDPASVRDASCDGGCASDAGSVVPARDGGTDAGPTSPPANTCTTAREIGSLAGDAPSPPLSTQGTCAEYVSFRATEQSNGAIGTPMRVGLTLSPAGHDFDLYAFVDLARDQLACALPFARSETNGTSAESIALEWGEGSVANGSDDSRTVVVAVTSASGPCPPGASWTLTVTGNP